MLKKVLKIILPLVLALVLTFGAVATLQVNQIHAAPAKTGLTKTAANSTDTQSLIAKANPYVHVSNYIAKIDPALNQVLTASEIAVVKQYVQTYNAQAYSQKAQPHTVFASSIKATASTPMAANSCSNGITSYSYWWGYAYTLNHCLINQLWTIAIVDGATAAAVALVCDFISLGTCALVEGAIGLAIGTYVTALQSADSACGNKGANLNIPFTGTAFVNSVC